MLSFLQSAEQLCTTRCGPEQGEASGRKWRQHSGDADWVALWQTVMGTKRSQGVRPGGPPSEALPRGCGLSPTAGLLQRHW